MLDLDNVKLLDRSNKGKIRNPLVIVENLKSGKQTEDITNEHYLDLQYRH